MDGMNKDTSSFPPSRPYFSVIDLIIIKGRSQGHMARTLDKPQSHEGNSAMMRAVLIERNLHLDTPTVRYVGYHRITDRPVQIYIP